MKASCIDYAMSVIVSSCASRCEGQLEAGKVGFYTRCTKMEVRSDTKFRKSATVVGDVLGSMVHGDIAVYGVFSEDGAGFFFEISH